MSTQEDLIEAITADGVRDPRVLEALREVPRAEFVPSEAADQAYLDRPLPIGYGQVTTQPSLVAKMVEALDLSGSERVLEIGAGHGFQTALLGRLSGFVWSVEYREEVATRARANLARQGIENTRIVVGDGTEGLSSCAPFEAIVVTAAFPSVPSPLGLQLAVGGRLVQPVGRGGQDRVELLEKVPYKGLVYRRTITWARFVRLYGAHAFCEEGE